jgi:hypothetical protein
MNSKKMYLLCLVFSLGIGTAFAQIGTGLDSGPYIRSDAGRGRNQEHFIIGDRLSDSSFPVSFIRANGRTNWEGIGRIDPNDNRRLNIFVGNTSTHEFEILSSSSFRYQGVEYILFSREGPIPVR